MDLDLGNGVIRMINTSSKTLEAMLKTYKTCKSPRDKDGTKQGATIANKQVERRSCGSSDTAGASDPEGASDQYGKQTLAAAALTQGIGPNVVTVHRDREDTGVGSRQQ